jgi:hypothetical protein
MSDYGEWDFDADEQVFNLNVRIPMQICGDVQSGYRLIDLFMITWAIITQTMGGIHYG